MTVNTVSDYYGHKAFDPITDLSFHLRRAMKGVKYDTLVGTGISGTVFASRVARSVGKKFAIVRKDETTHDRHKVVGVVGNRWLFVDDFISRGETIRRVQNKMDGFYEDYKYSFDDVRPEFVGVYEFDYNKFTPLRNISYGFLNDRRQQIADNDFMLQLR